MTDCVLWDGPLTPQGYGRVGRSGLAHRQAWELEHGPIPQGRVIHHRCGNKLCVNAEHLECLTHAQHNSLHGNAAAWYQRQRSKTHCPQGHEYTDANTLVKRGRRHCRTCERRRFREWYYRQKAARA